MAAISVLPALLLPLSTTTSGNDTSRTIRSPKLVSASLKIVAAKCVSRQSFGSTEKWSSERWSAERWRTERWSTRGGPHSRVYASGDEIPNEILEDSKFVPITAEDPRFGPPAILLLGFTSEESLKVQTLLKDMEGDFMKVVLCTEEMAKGTLGKALDAVQPNLMEVQVAKGLPRIAFLSGLTGEEIMMVIQIFPETGLESAVFAAHVPLNSEKSMEELMEEIMDDHQRLKKPREPVEQES